MSLISDALQKAQQQQSAEPVRTSSWNLAGAAPLGGRARTERTSSAKFILANFAVLAAICVIVLYVFREQPYPYGFGGHATAVATVANARTTAMENATVPTAGLSSVESETSTEQTASTAVVVPPATTEYDLNGTSTLGSNTLLSIVRRDDKRSLWVPVGKTVAEVTGVSYDPAEDRAVIRVRGNLFSVKMREPSAAPAAEPTARTAE
ncbi:MAG: hypothetical protein ABIZ04_26810 [Opitutus sp.]